MRACTRGPAPELFATHGAERARTYAARRQTEPSFRFQWYRPLLGAARAALGLMTDERCSYCDGHPIDAVGEETVDHFCPKGRPEFYELVCEWTNLFLTCSACNNAKREQWEKALLRPDDVAFRFERYFEYRFDSGELHPAPTASPDEQARAQATIRIFKLNRPGACTSRKRTVDWIRRLPETPESDLAYRYLVPLCRAAAVAD